jgi:GNAT superfamily N-acetyltransferase
VSVKIELRPSSLCFDDFRKLDERCFPDEPVSRESFDAFVRSHFWEAKSDGRLVGYSCLKVKPKFAWIARIGVLPTERNKGIGTRLMKAMIEYCLEIPRHTAILYVLRDNPAAIHLYQKHGFHVSEDSYQYIVTINRVLAERGAGNWQSVHAVPLSDAPEKQQLDLPPQWSDLAELHDPPKTYVLAFFLENKRQIGYCRLNPDFPGCFPFELSTPSRQLPGALAALKPYLSKQHRILKLTFANPQMALACDAQGFKLNYRLHKMTLELRDS